MTYITIRDITQDECPWLDETITKGTTVEKFNGYTYGCISSDGEAFCHDKSGPFFELPTDCVRRK